MGTPQNMVSFQHAVFARNIAHTEANYHFGHNSCTCQMQTQWAHHKTWCLFNMLDLHEASPMLSRCHHFGHKNCTCRMKNTIGTPQSMVSFQTETHHADTQDCWQRLNRSLHEPCASTARRPTTHHHHHLHLHNRQQQ